MRGRRVVSDFEFEFQRALLNRVADDTIETVFIMTKEDFVFLNSSIVKEVALFKGRLNGLVPEIVEKKGKKIPMDEGCLSIPDIREKVFRPETIVIRYQDENFQEKEQEFSGWMARIIQHEYDHLKGILFIDYLSSFRKRMVKSDLQEIPFEYLVK